MNGKLAIVVSFLGLLSVTSAQISQIGQCDPAIRLQEGFSAVQIEGKWFEIRRTEAGGVCSDWEITRTSNTNFAFTYGEVAGFRETQNFQGTYETGTAKFTLTNSGGNSRDFWILGLIGENYAVVYRCENVGTTNRNVFITLLGKEKGAIGQTNQNAINTVLAPLNINFNQLPEVDHTDTACTELPVIPAGQPIILPGQCDPNIAVMPDFNATAYLDLWHLVETYHSDFQLGECNDATYSLQDDGSVLVFNTEVINQNLATITGRAEVVANAKLSVTFPTAPFPIDYWILDTDYTSFALVYSCMNLDTSRQQVWSWKMSRTRSLTPQAVERINQKISGIRVLNNRYYRDVDNTAKACFYFPEANGEPVTFRGQCDESIQVHTNFNATAYMGTWYDIERYPQRDQFGTCGTATYTLGDVVNVFNTEVINQTLSTITGTGVPLPSNNGEAKLTVTFPIEVAPGVIVDAVSPYWVLATDYTDYALVYACQNIGSDRRSVSSWKLSRTKSLSTQARTAIDNRIQGIDVLDQRYYKEQDHTDEGCFYYPEVTGRPVVLPGQCDTNIPVQRNFSFEDYSGNWYQIQRYPQMWETGNCTGARYTINADGNVDVLNWQVINGELDTIEGTAKPIGTDGSGRVRVTLPSRAEGAAEGATVEMDLYVLKTDYETYSLTYSCVNINENQRQLGVWKLSRTRALPAAAAREINAYMADRRELDQRYFVDVAQDEECEEPSSGYFVQSSIIVLLVCSFLQLFK